MKIVKVCPNCGKKPKYIERHQMYFCSKCVEYIIPVERKEKEKKEVIKKDKKEIKTSTLANNPNNWIFFGLGVMIIGFIIPSVIYLSLYVSDPGFGIQMMGPFITNIMAVFGIILIMIGLGTTLSQMP